MRKLGLLAYGLAIHVAQANEVIRPRQANDLKAHFSRPYNHVTEDRFVRVRGAEVAWFDRETLTRDFAFLRRLSDEQIQSWILDNFAYVSRGQLELRGIRISDLPVDETKERLAYRPTTWNRAAIFEARDLNARTTGMVDIKGIGLPTDSSEIKSTVEEFQSRKGNTWAIDRLRTKDHSDGSMTFGEAIAETSRQLAEQRLFDIHNAKDGGHRQSIDSYFIISFPGEILKDEGRSEPMAIYGRQAHFGRSHNPAASRGISTDSHGGHQSSDYGARVDYGGAIITDPRLADNFGALPNLNSIEHGDPQSTKAWAWGHDTARAFRRGDKQAVYRHLREMLAPIQYEWEQVPHGRAKGASQAEILLLSRRAAQPTRSVNELLALFRSIPGQGQGPELGARALVRHLSHENLRKLLPHLKELGPFLPSDIRRRILREGINVGPAGLLFFLEEEKEAPKDAQHLARVTGYPVPDGFQWARFATAFKRAVANADHLPLAAYDARVNELLQKVGLPPSARNEWGSFEHSGRLLAPDAFTPPHIEASAARLVERLSERADDEFLKLAQEHRGALRKSPAFGELLKLPLKEQNYLFTRLVEDGALSSSQIETLIGNWIRRGVSLQFLRHGENAIRFSEEGSHFQLPLDASVTESAKDRILEALLAQTTKPTVIKPNGTSSLSNLHPGQIDPRLQAALDYVDLRAALKRPSRTSSVQAAYIERALQDLEAPRLPARDAIFLLGNIARTGGDERAEYAARLAPHLARYGAQLPDELRERFHLATPATANPCAAALRKIL